jgi:hypothetical protein
MNTEFNSILEDDSAIQISRLLLKYRQMIRKNQLIELNEDLQKRFPNKAENTVNSSIKVKNQTEDVKINLIYIFNKFFHYFHIKDVF